MRGRAAGVLVAGVLSVTGCAQQVGEEPPPKPVATRTVVSVVASPLPVLPHEQVTGKLPKAYSAQNRIVIGKHVVDVSPLRADLVVSTRGGIYFLNAGELWFLADHGARSTGFSGLGRVVVSPDGRYLGFVDRNHGPGLSGGQLVAAAVAYDTTTGKVQLRSYAGMGKASSDLRAAYAAHPPLAIDIAGGDFIATTPSGTWRYPLQGGAPVHVD